MYVALTLRRITCLTVGIVSPKTAKALLDAGYIVRVERSAERIYNDEEFAEVGAELVPAGSWVKAPKEDIIFGLKELPEDDIDLPHSYIHFQHIFKKQTGWAPSLSRFARAGGTLYDLEFLVNSDNRRIAAFGYWAGYAGTAVAFISWAHQILNPGVTQPQVPLFENAPALISHVKSVLEPAIRANNGQAPRIIVIGALGRCGSGAVQFCREAGLDEESIIKWDLQETTAKPGPYKEVCSPLCFFNIVYINFCRLRNRTSSSTASILDPTLLLLSLPLILLRPRIGSYESSAMFHVTRIGLSPLVVDILALIILTTAQSEQPYPHLFNLVHFRQAYDSNLQTCQ